MTENRILIGSSVYIARRGKKGIWTADYHRKGKHCRTTLGTRNYDEARKRAVKLDLALSEDCAPEIFRKGKTSTTTGEQPVAIAAADFIAFQHTECKREKTIVKYRGALEIFRKFCDLHAITDLSQITLSFIDKYRAERMKVLMPRSMFFEGHLLKQFLGWCVDRDLLSKNPMQALTFPKVRLEKKEVLTLLQVQQILDASTVYRLPMLAMLALTGMRSGELVHLRLEDVEFAGNWIHIVSRPGLETKNGSSRKVPLHPMLKHILLTMARRQRQWFFTAVPSDQYPDGNHEISAKKLNEDFGLKLKQLGIPAGRNGGFTIHSLRHFFRTYTVNNSVPERVINEWVGHAPDRSMGSIYYHLSDDESQRFMSQLSFEPAGSNMQK